jgi:hypothetical protein
MRKDAIVGFVVAAATAGIPEARAQQGIARKYDPFDYPVTVSKCLAADNKYDPNPAVRVDITVDLLTTSVTPSRIQGTSSFRPYRKMPCERFGASRRAFGSTLWWKPACLALFRGPGELNSAAWGRIVEV